MTAFVAIAVVLAIGALLFVLPPLLRTRGVTGGVSRRAVNITVYRDQLRELETDLADGAITRDRYDEARREIERRLLEDAAADDAAARPQRARYSALIVGVSVPVLAAALYVVTGTPGALNPERAGAEQAHALDRQQMEALVASLAQKLRQSPEANPEGWAMLARSYNSMGRFGDAVEAYREAVKRGEPDARLLADYADALAMAQGRTLIGEPEKIIRQALKLDPNNVKALALAGTVEFDQKNYRQAVAYWEKILAVVPPDSEIARSVQGSIAEARSLGGIQGPVASAATPKAAEPAPVASAAGAGSSVAGEVRIDPALASRIAPGDTVFIFARPAEGSRMPLAILRKSASELPARFVLDDAMAMTPQGKLSAYPQVVVGARVSKSGSAMPQSGDLEGVSKPVKMGAANTVVVINQVVQ